MGWDGGGYNRLIKYYPWPLLAPQLYFSVEGHGICLRPFASLVQLNFGKVEPETAAELAYFWVVKEYRGRGLSSLLFSEFLARCQTLLKEGDLVFTIAQGVSTGNQGAKLLIYLLQVEVRQNGFRKDGSVVVTTALVQICQAFLVTGLGEEDFLVKPQSVATRVLAEKHQFTFLGFAKTLGWLYAKIL